MPVRVEVELRGKAVEGLRRVAREWPEAQQKAVVYMAAVVEDEAKLNLRGRVLHRRESRLASSVHTVVRGSAAEVGTNVIYGPLHEFGRTSQGRTEIGPPYVRGTGPMRFMVDGKWVCTHRVKLVERPWLRPAIADNMDKLGDAAVKALDEFVKARGAR